MSANIIGIINAFVSLVVLYFTLKSQQLLKERDIEIKQREIESKRRADGIARAAVLVKEIVATSFSARNDLDANVTELKCLIESFEAISRSDAQTLKQRYFSITEDFETWKQSIAAITFRVMYRT